MTKEQYDRWRDFSLRMAEVASPSPEELETVRHHIEQIVDECSDDSFGCAYSTIADWDNHEPVPGDDGTVGYALRHHPRLICDLVSDYCFDERLEYEQADEEGDVDLIETAVCSAVRSCVRAGLDVAVSPSAGVVGFTAGHIRKMYPEGVPTWVKEFFQPGELIALHQTNIEGIYVPEVTGFDSRTFDELHDTEQVWV